MNVLMVMRNRAARLIGPVHQRIVPLMLAQIARRQAR
jgi:hypothetical protein